MAATISKRLYCLPLALAFAGAFSFQGSRGLYETSEGRYAECAREMMETGNYLEPRLGYRPHFAEPPLTYWAIAAGLGTLGKNEWGARLYGALGFVLAVLVVMGVGEALWDRLSGFLAGLVYASSPYPLIGAFSATTDTLLALWELAAVLCYLRASKADPPPSRCSRRGRRRRSGCGRSF